MSKASMSRRDFLLASVLGASAYLPLSPSASSAFSPLSFSAGSAAAESEHWLGAVFDQRFPLSLAFANSASRQHIPALGFAGDMSQLWFERLLPELQVRPRAFVGLTSARGLFCFEQLAWGVGLRVALRIEHRAADRRVQPGTGQQIPFPLARPEAEDGAMDASAVLAALGHRESWSDCTHVNAPHTDGCGAEALVAWVIAPSKTVNS